MEQFAQALKEIKEKVNAIELKLSQYIDSVHGASTEGIDESQGAIVDLEIESAILDQRVTALEEKLGIKEEEEPEVEPEEEE